MQEITLTPTSFIVLGLLATLGEASPYQLKQQVAAAIGNFWSVPHSQLYAEPARLARAGYATEQQEAAGRRRKRYALTDRGRAALDSWKNAPTEQFPELRDLSLLKLFFGGDPASLAAAQLAAHRRKLEFYESVVAGDQGHEPRGPWRTLRAGILHERDWVEYWSELAEEAD